MTKTFHFLAGLPRSGNTVLSSILNQNPEIYSSELSPLPSLLYEIEKTLNYDNNAQRLETKDNINYVINNITHNYFNHIKKPTILIREKAWATTGNLRLIKNYINPTPKIIFTTRPILEILTSFINILPEWSYVDEDMLNTGFWYKNYLTKNDNRCDYLMKSQGLIDQLLLSINSIIEPENKDVFCIIKYNDIVNTPQETMDKIYTFLELPTYKHNFNNIIKLEKDNDEANGHPKDLHKVRPQLKKVSKDPKEVLSEYVINKYSNIGWEA
jgi:sulfotransferase